MANCKPNRFIELNINNIEVIENELKQLKQLKQLKELKKNNKYHFDNDTLIIHDNNIKKLKLLGFITIFQLNRNSIIKPNYSYECGIILNEMMILKYHIKNIIVNVNNVQYFKYYDKNIKFPVKYLKLTIISSSLITIKISRTSLSSLNLECPELKNLIMTKNYYLDSLDLKNCQKLILLKESFSRIKNILNIPNKLHYLILKKNKIKSLNLNNLHNLKMCIIHSIPIQVLYIKKIYALELCNTNLKKICFNIDYHDLMVQGVPALLQDSILPRIQKGYISMNQYTKKIIKNPLKFYKTDLTWLYQRNNSKYNRPMQIYDNKYLKEIVININYSLNNCEQDSFIPIEDILNYIHYDSEKIKLTTNYNIKEISKRNYKSNIYKKSFSGSYKSYQNEINEYSKFFE